jgi:phospholipid/cholesterol/gamma-HCH transport system permease protein
VALLVAGRVGAGIGAELANMRATEQIDAIETLSINSFKFLVVTRVVACILILPMLTIFMDFTGIFGGFVSEHILSNLSWSLYLDRAFDNVALANFVPPTLKTAVFGFIIGTVVLLLRLHHQRGSDGVRRASTNSVVLSSLLIILSDVVLVKCIFFFFPDQAI